MCDFTAKTHRGQVANLRANLQTRSLAACENWFIVHGACGDPQPCAISFARPISPHTISFCLLFVSEKIDKRRPIASMPGVFQLPPGEIVDEARQAQDAGLQAVLLFGIPQIKDEQASGAYAENGIVQKAFRALKDNCPEVVAITDVCLCKYMSHGHCGVTRIDGDHFHVLNDQSVDLLAKTALSHAQAGADMVAPSDMMDCRIGAIREAH